MCDQFLSGLGQRLATLERCAANGERDALKREAHSLKGIAATFGLTALQAVAAETEKGARADSPEMTAARTARLRLLAEAAPELLGTG